MISHIEVRPRHSTATDTVSILEDCNEETYYNMSVKYNTPPDSSQHPEKRSSTETESLKRPMSAGEPIYDEVYEMTEAVPKPASSNQQMYSHNDETSFIVDSKVADDNNKSQRLESCASDDVYSYTTSHFSRASSNPDSITQNTFGTTSGVYEDYMESYLKPVN